MSRSYHHGDLARAAVEAVAQLLADEGLEGVTVRRVASQLDVSHTAVLHHFDSRAGLLTAVAAQGFDRLAGALASASSSFLDMGVAYVAFARSSPGHFVAMFATDSVVEGDAELVAARDRAMAELRRGVDAVADVVDGGEREGMAAATLAGWSMMHGLVHLLASKTLQASGLVDDLGRPDVDDLARRIGTMLYGSRSPD